MPDQVEAPEPQPLVCSNCDAWVGDVQVVSPDPDGDATNVRGTCPWCGDHSWAVEVRGAFGIMGAAEPNPDDPLDEFPSTASSDMDIEGGMTTIVFVKAHEHARKLRVEDRR